MQTCYCSKGSTCTRTCPCSKAGKVCASARCSCDPNVCMNRRGKKGSGTVPSAASKVAQARTSSSPLSRTLGAPAERPRGRVQAPAKKDAGRARGKKARKSSFSRSDTYSYSYSSYSSSSGPRSPPRRTPKKANSSTAPAARTLRASATPPTVVPRVDDALFTTVHDSLRHHTRSNNLSQKRARVIEHRRGKDLYTGTSARNASDPHVDHIVEVQLLAHSAVAALGSAAARSSNVDVLAGIVNHPSLDNYNVTPGTINLSKGQMIKSFLGDGNKRGLPLRAIVLGYKCERHINPICNAMMAASDVVQAELQSARRADGHVPGNSATFDDVSDALSVSFEAMDLQNEGLGTRSRRR